MFFKYRHLSAFHTLCLGLPLILCTAGCDFSESQRDKPKAVEAARTYTKAERISQVTKMLEARHPLPSPLLDAYVDEKPDDDGTGLGPTDSTVYLYLKVAPEDMKKWDALLGEKASIGSYSPEPQPYSWWIDGSRFKTLEHYEPLDLLTLQGWVAVSRTTGEIWVLGRKT